MVEKGRIGEEDLEKEGRKGCYWKRERRREMREGEREMEGNGLMGLWKGRV